jgi:VanZ family protein
MKWPQQLKIIVWSYVVLFYFLLLKPAGVDQAPLPFEHMDKLIHFGGHFLLIGLLLTIYPRKIKMTLLLVIVMAFVTEFLQQGIPGRSFDTLDILANTLGVLSGFSVFLLKEKMRT